MDTLRTDISSEAEGQWREALSSEKLPGVEGPFRTFDDAKAKTNARLGAKDNYVIFAIQGDWNNNTPPPANATSEQIKASFDWKAASAGMFNYALYMPSTDLWLDGNVHAHHQSKVPQEFYAKKGPLQKFTDVYKKTHEATIYYVRIFRSK